MIHLAPTWSPARQQQVFRRVLHAMSFPAGPTSLADLLEPETDAMLAVLSSVVDQGTTIHDVDGLVSATALGLLEARWAQFDQAAFVLVSGAASPPTHTAPRLGDTYRPDCGATLLVAVSELASDTSPLGTGRDLGPTTRLTATGPGIDGRASLTAVGLDHGWLTARRAWLANPPAGVDLILCAPDAIAALPRSTCLAEFSHA